MNIKPFLEFFKSFVVVFQGHFRPAVPAPWFIPTELRTTVAPVGVTVNQTSPAPLHLSQWTDASVLKGRIRMTTANVFLQTDAHATSKVP